MLPITIRLNTAYQGDKRLVAVKFESLCAAGRLAEIMHKHLGFSDARFTFNDIELAKVFANDQAIFLEGAGYTVRRFGFTNPMDFR